MSELEFKKISLNELDDNLLFALRIQDQEYFPTPWSEDGWRSSLASSDRYALYVVKDGMAIAGFSLFYLLGEDHLAHLQKIVVGPKYRRDGVAMKLMSIALDDLKSSGFAKFYLEVEHGNSAAKSLYQKLAFKLIRVSKNFYGAEKDAEIMMLSL